MNLQDIKEFVVLANLCNYQEAADALFMSQPTLTRHIQRLEKDLGNELFIRTTRRMRLSNFGRLFLPYAQEFVCVEHNFQEEYKEYSRQSYETIHVCTIPAMAAYRFTDILSKFQNEDPRYRIEVEEISSLEGVFNRVIEGQVDFALVHGPDNWPKEIGHAPLFDDHLVVALPHGHPLSNMDHIHLSTLRNEVFITPPRTSPVFERFLETCHKLDFEPQIRYAGHREDVQLSLVRNGFGLGILLKQTGEYAHEEGIHLIDVSPAVSLPLSIAFADTPHMSAGRKAFLDCCRDTVSQSRTGRIFL